MSKIVQWKRGNVTVNDSYTGANGEITVDTTNWNLRVHDGVTAGGYTIDSSNGGGSFGNITVSGTTNLNGNVVANSTSKFGNVIIIENSIFASSITGNGNISIGANGQIGLQFRADNGRLGYNTEPWPTGIGYDIDFGNTSVKAREFYADANFPTGFQFTTADGDTGLSHSYDTSQGNVSLVRIRHAGTAVAEFFDNAHTTLTGNLVVSSDGSTYGTFPNAFVQIYGNVDSYQQFVAQNINNGSDASTDIVATAGNGDDSSYYIDMGIASNTYAVSGFDVVGPNDGYLYVAGASYLGPVDGTANLNLGSTTGSTRTWAGQGTVANIVTTVSETGFTVNKGAFVVAANSAPAANNSTGVAGTIAWDSDYIYVCVATDTWKRANLSTW